jgi:hypothetical protein
MLKSFQYCSAATCPMNGVVHQASGTLSADAIFGNPLAKEFR